MAVQAPFQCSPNAFPLNFQTSRETNHKNEQIIDLLGQHHQLQNHHQQQQQQLLSDPKSDLTSSVAFGSSTRKRGRVELATAMLDHQQFRQQIPLPCKFPKTEIITNSGNNQQQNRAIESAAPSTSGRPMLPSASQHAAEIDALLRLHSADLRSGMEAIQKRHCAEIVRGLETGAAKKIAEKEAEIETLRRKQAELESRMKQISAEGQIWFTVARNSEALASNLRASLDQVLRRGADAGGHGGQAEDAESCCHGGDDEDRSGQRSCRVCRERDVSVLLLPCRHMCLCLECEPATDTCPICSAAKNVGLQVFLE